MGMVLDVMVGMMVVMGGGYAGGYDGYGDGYDGYHDG